MQSNRQTGQEQEVRRDQNGFRQFIANTPSRRGREQGKSPTSQEREKAYKELEKLVEGGATKTQLVQHLVDLNWSTAAICETVRYESDTAYHKRGDKMLPQHVNQIRSKYLQEKARLQQMEAQKSQEQVQREEAEAA